MCLLACLVQYILVICLDDSVMCHPMVAGLLGIAIKNPFAFGRCFYNTLRNVQFQWFLERMQTARRYPTLTNYQVKEQM